MELFREDLDFDDLDFLSNPFESLAADLEQLKNTLHPTLFSLFVEEMNSYLDGVLKRKQLKILAQHREEARIIGNEALIVDYQDATNDILKHGPNLNIPTRINVLANEDYQDATNDILIHGPNLNIPTRINVLANEVAAPSENNFSARDQSDAGVSGVYQKNKENSLVPDNPHESMISSNSRNNRKPRHPLLQKLDDYMAPLISKPLPSISRRVEPVLQNSQGASSVGYYRAIVHKESTTNSKQRARKKRIISDFSDSSDSESEESHIKPKKSFPRVEERRNSSDSASDISSGSPIIQPSKSKHVMPAEQRRSKSKSASLKKKAITPKAKSTNKKAGKKDPNTEQSTIPVVFVDTFDTSADFEDGPEENNSHQEIDIADTAQPSKSNKGVSKKQGPAPKKPLGGEKKFEKEAKSSSIDVSGPTVEAKVTSNRNKKTAVAKKITEKKPNVRKGKEKPTKISTKNKSLTKEADIIPSEPEDKGADDPGPSSQRAVSSRRKKRKPAAKVVTQKSPVVEEEKTSNKNTAKSKACNQQTTKKEEDKKVTNKSQKKEPNTKKDESVDKTKKPARKKKAPPKEKKKDGKSDEHEDISETEGPPAKKAKKPLKGNPKKKNENNGPKKKPLPKKVKKGAEKEMSPIGEKANGGEAQDTFSDFDSDSDDSVFGNENLTNFSVSKCLLSAKKDAPMISGSVTPQMVGLRMQSFDFESDDNLSVLSTNFRGADKFVAKRMAKANKPKQPKSLAHPAVGNPKVSDLLTTIHKKSGHSVTPKMIKKLFKPRVQERDSSSVESSESSSDV